MLCIPCEERDSALMPKLPPLPTPDLRTQRKQSMIGIGTVLGVITLCLGVGHAALLPEGLSSLTVRWVLLGMLYGESAIAIVCLVGILLSDPGVVKRNVRNCLPIPEEVAERLTSDSPQQEQYDANISEGDRVYCVRCFVWRDHQAQSVGPVTRLLQLRCIDSWLQRRFRGHHCRTCQRCVLYFDHHCGVFGRCIAGRGLTGNMGYFCTILVMGQLGWLTTIISVCLSVIYRITDANAASVNNSSVQLAK
ncbi:hypothetical protein AB1Y20_017482 [Prymnesium parvum]|uniref:Palmitoyltransferase n=1 Tax=Prymnesium parvum TaxID=97485 RepID=A0AB34JKM5_PRYPA